MHRLHLLRHAKSSWDDPTLDDQARPLSPRGRKAAARVARWLEGHDVRPQLVLCSPAVRTTATLELVLGALGSPETSVEQALYLASVDTLLGRARSLPETLPEALVIGHNPGLAELCVLARQGPERDRVLADGLPTGALATLALDGSWRELAPGRADLVRLVLPREL